MKNFSPDDDQLRNLLQNHEFEFLPQAWDNMQKKLQQPQPKTRGLAWWWASVGFCSVLGISIASYAFLFSNPTKSELLPSDQLIVPVSLPATQPKAQQEQPTAYYSNNNPNVNSIAATSTNNNPKKITNQTKAAKKQLKNSVDKIAKPQYIPNLQMQQIKVLEQKTQINAPQPMAYNAEFCPAEVKAQVVSSLPNNNNQEPTAIELGKNKNRRLRAQIWFGTTANKPANNAVALGLQLGAGVDYQLSKRQHLSAGLQYKQLFTTPDFVGATIPMAATYLSGNSFDSGSPLYSKTQVYELQRVDFLELPISYHFQLAPRHSVSATAKVGLVIHTATLNANEQQPAQMTAQDLDLSRTTAALGLGYEWRFGKKWSVGVQANVGLNNLALNSQKEYRAYTSYAGETAQKGELFLMLNESSTKPAMMRMPEKVYNSDLQIAAKYTF